MTTKNTKVTAVMGPLAAISALVPSKQAAGEFKTLASTYKHIDFSGKGDVGHTEAVQVVSDLRTELSRFSKTNEFGSLKQFVEQDVIASIQKSANITANGRDTATHTGAGAQPQQQMQTPQSRGGQQK